jgi:hypothetical protein
MKIVEARKSEFYVFSNEELIEELTQLYSQRDFERSEGYLGSTKE